jgi:MYXO-CTERM domain-containing protein
LFVAPAVAGASKPLINYFKPMPIVGSLSTTVWGASTVGARDPANGLEDDGSKGGVGPHQEANYYWDGKIVKGEDGKYHLYASHWTYSNGFGPPIGASGTGWQSSIPLQAVSDDIMGPYVVQGNCYEKNQEGNNKGHNTTALVRPTGSAPYVLSVGEIVAGQMFSATSANGPWTLLGLATTNTNGHNGCGTLSSNFTFTVGPSNRFWATSRNGCVMDSDDVLGTYKVETDSVLPNLENNANANAEDEVIWFSGGYFHIVYNYWNVQRAYHIMSKDGVTGWTSTGLAYQAVQTPANTNSDWLRYTDGTVNQWHNMERASVYEQNGHVTHFTFAVTDVDKNTSAVNSGGSKILVVPFDGVAFDCDNGDAASCAELAGGGAGGIGGAGAGAAGTGGAAAGTGGGAGQGGAAIGGASGAANGGSSAGAATSGAAGITSGTGGTAGVFAGAGAGATSGTAGTTNGTGGSGGKPGGAGGGAGQQPSATGGAGAGGTERTGSPSGAGTNSGCSCRVGATGERRGAAAFVLLGVIAGARRIRRRSAGRR